MRSRGVVAGIAAAAAWAAAEPLVGRLLATPYRDLRLLGAAVTSGPLWRPAGLAFHLVNGAAFGFAFERLGGRGWKQGALAAHAENLVLWPGMALVDRIHPDRKSGTWPPLLRNGRVFAYEVAVHALFGTILGALVPADS